ncbi:MAG: DNA polymerase domain-containing protein [Promethearchaeota archaeon]
MSDNRFWLLDAVYSETDHAVMLTFLDSASQKLTTIKVDFEPYFYAQPATLGEAVQRKELMKDEFITVARVPSSLQTRLDREWERNIDPGLSYVYDQNQRFGCPHIKSQRGYSLDLHFPSTELDEFDTLFAETADQDPLKFAFLKEYFRYAVQPVPEIPQSLLTSNTTYDESKILWASMLARIANIPFRRALTSRSVSEWIRSMLHTTYRKLGILIPNPDDLTKGHKPHRVEGALTIAPTPGTYYNMTVLDFESLYPSLIDTYNLSYETMDCEHDDCKTHAVPDEPHYVCNQRRGIFSALIGALKDLRIHWFKPRSRQMNLPQKQRTQARTISDLLKFLLVSSGGVTIRIQGLASPPLAESMMAYGRWSLRTTWDFAIEHSMHPIYGDTDSIFLDNPNPKQIDWLIKIVQDELKLKLAIDVVYKLCVFSSAKKAYFGILQDGKPDIKGITLGKSSTPPRFREIFLEAVKPLALVENPAKLEDAKLEIVGILQREITRLRRRDFAVDEMEYRVKVWKGDKEREKGTALAQPYQALQQLSDKGIKVKKRDEVRFVKVNPFRYGARTFTVKPTHMATKDEIDIPDYIRKLEMAFEQILVPLDIEFPKQQSRPLDAYLSDEIAQPFNDTTEETLESRDRKPPKQQKRLLDYTSSDENEN